LPHILHEVRILHLLADQVEVLLLEVKLLLLVLHLELLVLLQLVDFLLVLGSSELLGLSLLLDLEVGVQIGTVVLFLILLATQLHSALILLITLGLLDLKVGQPCCIVLLRFLEFLILSSDVAVRLIDLLSLVGILLTLVLNKLSLLSLDLDFVVDLNLVVGGKEVLVLSELALKISLQAVGENLDVSDFDSLNLHSPTLNFISNLLNDKGSDLITILDDFVDSGVSNVVSNNGCDHDGNETVCGSGNVRDQVLTQVSESS